MIKERLSKLISNQLKTTLPSTISTLLQTDLTILKLGTVQPKLLSAPQIKRTGMLVNLQLVQKPEIDFSS